MNNKQIIEKLQVWIDSLRTLYFSEGDLEQAELILMLAEDIQHFHYLIETEKEDDNFER